VNCAPDDVADAPIEVTTETLTVPALCAGTYTTIDDDDVTEKFVDIASPNMTAVTDEKLLPVIVTGYIPFVEPVWTDKSVTCGGE
jgi:hypothetical protein